MVLLKASGQMTCGNLNPGTSSNVECHLETATVPGFMTVSLTWKKVTKTAVVNLSLSPLDLVFSFSASKRSRRRIKVYHHMCIIYDTSTIRRIVPSKHWTAYVKPEWVDVCRQIILMSRTIIDPHGIHFREKVTSGGKEDRQYHSAAYLTVG